MNCCQHCPPGHVRPHPEDCHSPHCNRLDTDQPPVQATPRDVMTTTDKEPDMGETAKARPSRPPCVCGHVAAHHDRRRSIPQGIMADYKTVWACGWTGCGCRRYVEAEVPVTTEPSVSDVPSRSFIDGLREAYKVVERQSALADLIHFDRPSDFRKGVLTCLVALEKAIDEAVENGPERASADSSTTGGSAHYEQEQQ